MSEVFLTREEIEHPYANLAVMLEDKRKKAEQMRRTVFARITASPEVLAESVVYTYEMAIGGSTFRVYWTSPFVENFYPDKAGAIAATVAKLKEVEK